MQNKPQIPVSKIGSKKIEQLFSSYELAKKFCLDTKGYEINYPLIPFAFWKDREQKRIEQKQYVPFKEHLNIVYASQIPEDHYARLDSSYGQILFYASHKHAVQDRLTIMRVGRYLGQHTSLYQYQVKALTEFFLTKQKSDLLVRIEYSRASFRKAYEKGPFSCMKEFWYRLPCHPVEVYAAGDLAIAYKVSSKNPENVLARSIVWPEKRIFNRIYGDVRNSAANNLEFLLREKGYGYSDNFAGAKLLKIPAYRFSWLRSILRRPNRKFKMPYIDFSRHVEETASNFVVEEPNSYTAKGRVISCRTLSGYTSL